MVNRELCSQNTTKYLGQDICSQGSVRMDTAPAGSGPNAWLRILGSFLELPNIKTCSKTLHTLPQGPQTILVRYKVRFEAYVKSQPGRCPGWAWGGLCEVWCEQCCDPTVYGTVDGNTVRYRYYGTPPYFVRFSQIWDRITVDYGTVYGTVHTFPRLR